jgi:hypothetical protein
MISDGFMSGGERRKDGSEGGEKSGEKGVCAYIYRGGIG